MLDIKRYYTMKRYYAKLINTTSGHRVVFHHMAKCGGTSVSYALRRRYFLSYAGFTSEPIYRAMETFHPDATQMELIDHVRMFRQQLLLQHLFSDIRCISGHVHFSEAAYDLFNHQYAFITTLRDPVDLLLSSYRYDREQTNQRWQTNLTLEAYLETERASFFGLGFAHFYSGIPITPEPDQSALVDRAKSNLQKFALIGFTDDMPAFARRLRKLLGVRLSIGHENRTRTGRASSSDSVAPHIRRRIEAISEANLEIYEYARNKLSG